MVVFISPPIEFCGEKTDPERIDKQFPLLVCRSTVECILMLCLKGIIGVISGQVPWSKLVDLIKGQ